MFQVRFSVFISKSGFRTRKTLNVVVLSLPWERRLIKSKNQNRALLQLLREFSLFCVIRILLSKNQQARRTRGCFGLVSAGRAQFFFFSVMAFCLSFCRFGQNVEYPGEAKRPLELSESVVDCVSETSFPSVQFKCGHIHRTIVVQIKRMYRLGIVKVKCLFIHV